MRQFEDTIAPSAAALSELRTQYLDAVEHGLSSSVSPHRSGYLFKRGSGTIKNWSRRYFRINMSDCRLEYTNPKDPNASTVAVYLEGGSVGEIEQDDRRFVFQISAKGMYVL